MFPKHIELTIKFETDDLEFTEDDLKSILGKYSANISFNEKSFFLKLNAKANYKKANGQLQIITENGTKNTDDKIEASYHYPNDKTFEMIAKSFYWNKQIEKNIYITQKQISDKYNQNIEHVKRTLKQRFLSPKIINYITSNDINIQINTEQLKACTYWNWQDKEKLLLPKENISII